MRSAQKSNRSRGRGNRKGGGGGGNNINRVYDSAGPEGKVRGTPQQIIDKYLSLARDAQTSGDRVAAENFLQHAEHYQRILIQATQSQEQARREAQEAATDQPADRPNEATAVPLPVEQPSVPAAPVPEMTAAQAPAPDGAISGMTTIDAGTENASLLVDGEEMTKSQPRRNGDGRGRRSTRARKDAPETDSTAPEASADEQPSAAPAVAPAAPAEG
ncbi:MAG: DUF4167 domain-containing protein [Pseudomonadota bacterium]